MPSLTEILNDPNYVNANNATKEAIFNKFSVADPNFTNANTETKEAIRRRFGVVTAPQKEQGGFFSSFGHAATGLGDTGTAAKFVAASGKPQEAAAREALIAAQQPDYATTSFSDIKDPIDAFNWARQTAGSSLGSLAVPGAASLGAGLMRGPGMAKVAGLGVLGAQYLLENLGRQAATQKTAIEAKQAPEETSLGKAAIGATGQAALDAVAFKFLRPVIGKFPGVGKLFGTEGAKAAEQTAAQLATAFDKGTLKYSNGILKTVGLGVAVEVPQEIAQQALERWQAGLSLTDQDAIHEYTEAAAGAVLLGGGLGGMGTFMNNRAKISEAKQYLDIKEQTRAAAITPTGETVSTSPVVGTMEVDIGGVTSTKTTHQDGSIDIDGVQVTLPTAPAPPETLVEAPTEAPTEAALIREQLNTEAALIRARLNTPTYKWLSGGREVAKARLAELDAEAQKGTERQLTEDEINYRARIAEELDAEEAGGLDGAELGTTEQLDAAATGIGPEQLVLPFDAPSEAADTSATTRVEDAGDAARKLNVGEGAKPGALASWKKFISTNPDRAALETRLEAVNARLQTEQNRHKITALIAQRDTKIPEALAAVAAAAPAAAPATEDTATAQKVLEISDTTPEQKIEKLVKFGLTQEGAKEFVNSGDFKKFQDAYTAVEGNPASVDGVVAALRAELMIRGVKPRAATVKNTEKIILAASEEGAKGKPVGLAALAGIVAKNTKRVDFKKELEDLRKITVDPEDLNDIARISDELDVQTFDETAIGNTLRRIREDLSPAPATEKYVPITKKEHAEKERRAQERSREESTVLGVLKTGDINKVIDYFLRLGREPESDTKERVKTKRNVFLVGENKLTSLANKLTAETSSNLIQAIRTVVTAAKRGETRLAVALEEGLGINKLASFKLIGDMRKLKVITDGKVAFKEAEVVIDSITHEIQSSETEKLQVAESVYNLIGLRLKDINLTTKIQLEGEPDTNQDKINELYTKEGYASYDPLTDTIYVRKDGAVNDSKHSGDEVILHELVHAGTVKLLRLYEVNPNALLPNQREAIEHLHEIFKIAKDPNKNGKLKKYKAALANIYEFIAYGMTDAKFQQDLASIQDSGLTKYTKSQDSEVFSGSKTRNDFWSALTDTLLKLFDLLLPKMLKGVDHFRITEKKARRQIEGASAHTQVVVEGEGKPRVQETEIFAAMRQKKKPTYAEVRKDVNSIRTLYVRKDAGEFVARDYPGYEGNLALEISEIFGRILEAPTGPINIGVKLHAQATKQAPPIDTLRSSKTLYDEIDNNQTIKFPKQKGKWAFVKTFFTAQGYEDTVRKLQNDRAPLKTLENYLRLTGRLIVGEKGFNNLYSLLNASMGRAFHAMTQYVQAPMTDLQKAIEAYAKSEKVSTEEILPRLQLLLNLKHEPERRLVLFLRSVPLDEVGTKLREAIYTRLAEKDAAGEPVAIPRNEIKILRQDLEAIVELYKSALGLPPKGQTIKKTTDINNSEYNVLPGYSSGEIKREGENYDRELENNPAFKAIIDAMKATQEGTKKINEKANFWSTPVNNLVEFYDYKYYVPYKGKPGVSSEGDPRQVYNGKHGKNPDLAETPSMAQGRKSDPDNPLLQTMVDAAKASIRLGRRDVTQAIENMITAEDEKFKLIAGEKVATIPFSERHTFNWDDHRGPNNIIHYKADGTILIYKLNEGRISEAIRRSYEPTNPLIQMVNNMTSLMGQFHTRYNPSFSPMNFVRDALTNAFTIGAEMGPAEAGRFISAIVSNVVSNGLFKAGRIAHLYQNGKIDEIKKMGESENDTFVLDVLEYLQEGGRVSYIQGLAIKGQMDELVKEVGRSKLVQTKAQIDKWVDIWTDSFELTSRASAYAIAKSNAKARGLDDKAARIEGTTYAKNLANFEQVGEWGKTAGALFMFFRPAATGAVRALDALIPAFQSVESVIANMPKQLRGDKEAEATLRKNHAELKKNAQHMMMGLMGAGATIYAMALLVSGDDDQGRNMVATDDMARWTRYLRLPTNGLTGKDTGFLQLPWGFGFGAFAAAGAQIAAGATGNLKLSDMFGNLVNIGLDSYVPLPVSRMSLLKEPSNYIIDSFSPSLVRPFVEFAMNKDGLGRDIYNNRQSRIGDAYTGGDNIPEIYKFAAKALVNLTNKLGYPIDVSPNSMYFFANNYVDGVSRIAHDVWNISATLTGAKDFDPKTDLVVLDSFFGKKSNYDAREYAAIEDKIKDKEKILKMFEAHPEQYIEYMTSNPMDSAIVQEFNRQNGGTLKELRHHANLIRNMEGLSMRDRHTMLKDIVLTQNLVKRGIIDMFKQYDVHP